MLLEALLGIGIFGTVILVVFGLFPSTHQSITQARRYTEASNLARDTLELALASGLPPLTPTTNTNTTYVPVPTVVDGQATETLYTVTNTIAWTGSPPDDRCLVNVTVAWEEGNAGAGFKRQVQVATTVTTH